LVEPSLRLVRKGLKAVMALDPTALSHVADDLRVAEEANFKCLDDLWVLVKSVNAKV
jgi:hypothetical protein